VEKMCIYEIQMKNAQINGNRRGKGQDKTARATKPIRRLMAKVKQPYLDGTAIWNHEDEEEEVEDLIDIEMRQSNCSECSLRDDSDEYHP
jgi:hypothetical protein